MKSNVYICKRCAYWTERGDENGYYCDNYKKCKNNKRFEVR